MEAEERVRNKKNDGNICRQLNDAISECQDDEGRQLKFQHFLRTSAKSGNVSGVMNLIGHPLYSNYISKDGKSDCRGRESVAMVAIDEDNVEILKIFIENGINPFCTASFDGHPSTTAQRSFGDRSLFECACADHRINCVQFLLDILKSQSRDCLGSAGASSNIDALDSRYDFSAARHDFQKKHDLQRHHDDPQRHHDRRRHYDRDLQRQLLYQAAVVAVENDHSDVLCLLIETQMMDVNANFDNDIGTVLHVATRCNSIRCAEFLVAHETIELETIATDRQQTVLMTTAEYNNVDIMKLLLRRGVKIDRQTDQCSSALIVACHFGHKECVDTLLAAGADPHLKNRWGFTALYMGTDTPAILTRMLEESVDVNEHCGSRQEVALHLAAVIGSVDAVNALLDRGAEVNRRTMYNENALWLAIWKEHTDVARLLIHNNIQLDVESNGWQVYIWYYLPVEVALGLRNYDVVRMLLTAGCSLRNKRYYSDEDASPPPPAPAPASTPASASIAAAASADISASAPAAATAATASASASVAADKTAGPLAEDGMPWIRMRSEAFDYLRKDGEEYRWFKEHVTCAVSLKNLCRRLLRSVLNVPIRKKVTLLPLPSALKDYLMMYDL